MYSSELRIGICSCSEGYHGQLNGRVVDIPEIPITLSITEVIISKKDERLSIRQNRPHLFLDVHPTMEGCFTDLTIVNLYPSALGRGDQVFIGFRTKNIPFKETYWKKSEPATIDEILESIPGILLRRGVGRFNTWMDRMTPTNWVVPN